MRSKINGRTNLELGVFAIGVMQKLVKPGGVLLRLPDMQPYGGLRSGDEAWRRAHPRASPPDLEPANSVITRSRVARISTEPGGISQPSRIVTDPCGHSLRPGCQKDAIVRKAEAWVAQWVQLRLFLHGDFSLGEVISSRMGIRTAFV